MINGKLLLVMQVVNGELRPIITIITNISIQLFLFNQQHKIERKLGGGQLDSLVAAGVGSGPVMVLPETTLYRGPFLGLRGLSFIGVGVDVKSCIDIISKKTSRGLSERKSAMRKRQLTKRKKDSKSDETKD